MGVYIKGMNIPKDCPMCPMAHYNAQDDFTGCNVVNGKKYAMQTDAEYANSSTRPDWCPLVSVPPHGRLGDLDAVAYQLAKQETIDRQPRAIRRARKIVNEAPTLIPASEEVYNQYTDTVGNVHWTGTQTGMHVIPAEEGET